MVYLSSSKFSLAVLGNLGFALALATYKLVLRASRAAAAAACRRPRCSASLPRLPACLAMRCWCPALLALPRARALPWLLRTSLRRSAGAGLCAALPAPVGCAPHPHPAPVSAPLARSPLYTITQIFLGRLRDSEVERVNDKVGAGSAAPPLPYCVRPSRC